MALIKCPECGKEISDKASACIHCGITMEDIKNMQWEQEELQIDLNYDFVFICPKCANINGGKTQLQKHCITCGDIYIQTDIKRNEYQKIISDNLFKPTAYKIDEFQKKLKDRYVANTVDETEVNKARQKQEALTNAIIKDDTTKNENVPKCPTCQSTDINKISTVSKAGSVALWGIFSQKVKKQWHCNNCSTEW